MLYPLSTGDPLRRHAGWISLLFHTHAHTRPVYPAHTRADSTDSQTFEFFIVSNAVVGDDETAPRLHTLLRTSLRKHLAANGLSSESTITLEYAPALSAPTHAASQPTDDWIVSLDGDSGLALAGLASGQLQVFSPAHGGAAFSRVASASVHAGSVSAVHGLEAGCGGIAPGARPLLTAGKDGLARLWLLHPPEQSQTRRGGAARKAATPAAAEPTYSLTPSASLAGASAGLACGRLDPTGALAACGDDMGAVLVWSADWAVDAAAAAAAATASSDRTGLKKRGRTESSDPVVVGERASPRLPVASTVAVDASSSSGGDSSAPGGHVGPVTGVAWVSSTSFATTGWDGSVRVWDIDGAGASSSGSGGRGGLIGTVKMTSAKSATGISASPMGSTLVTSHTDHTLRLWDARGRRAAPVAALSGDSTRSSGLIGTLSTGNAWLTSVSWCPRSSYHLVSGAADGTVCLWDTRAATAPLFTIARHDERVLAVSWLAAAAAGADATAGAAADPSPSLWVLSGGAENSLHVAAAQDLGK